MYRTIVKIDGMACGMCEAHINDAIRKLYPNAKKVSSSYSKGELSFLTDDITNESDICRTIDDTGYTFISWESMPYEKKGLFGFLKSN